MACIDALAWCVVERRTSKIWAGMATFIWLKRFAVVRWQLGPGDELECLGNSCTAIGCCGRFPGVSIEKEGKLEGSNV